MSKSRDKNRESAKSEAELPVDPNELALAKVQAIVSRQVDLIAEEPGMLAGDVVNNLTRLANILLGMRKDDRDAARLIAQDESGVDSLTPSEIEAAIDDLRAVAEAKRRLR